MHITRSINLFRRLTKPNKRAMGLFSVLLFLVVAAQIIVLLLSPFYKVKWPFSWYYTRIFRPLLQEDQRFRWKFYVVPAFYLSLYCYIIFVLIRDVIPVIGNRLLSVEKLCIIPVLVVATPVLGWLSMTVKAKTSRGCQPGSAQEYDYDYILYYPNVQCRTCHIEKPARSRHCNLCRECVLVADHHCVWVNNCIGKGNYQFFYAFLVVNVISLSYGFLRVLWISVMKDPSMVVYPRSILIFTILCGTFAIICGVFTYLQLQLVNDGMTTGEKDKWYTIQQIMREGNLVRTLDGQFFIQDQQNPNQFYSTNAYDSKLYVPQNYSIVNDPKDITNIYDQGSFWYKLERLCT